MLSKTRSGLVAAFSRVASSRRPEVLLQPLAEARDVRGPAFPAADRVERQAELRDSEPSEQRVVELDHLGVDRRVVRPDRLDGQLPVLPETATLRRRIPVHGRDRVELDRLWLAMEAVLDVCAADRRRRLGTQRQRAAAPVLERVHLLLDDVRARSRGALEERRVLEDRRDDGPVAVDVAERLGLRDDAAPERLLGGQDVVCATGPLDLRPARHLCRSARRSARNGLRSSSAPSVVAGP